MDNAEKTASLLRETNTWLKKLKYFKLSLPLFIIFILLVLLEFTIGKIERLWVTYIQVYGTEINALAFILVFVLL